ncbi:MAG: alpha/beta hydrolase [Phormidesmis sp.]
MQYTRIGTGDYLVLVHGALADEKMWYPHIESLRFEYEAIAVTQRHFGGADEGGFGLNTHADDLAAFFSHLCKQKKVHTVGWSYGADVILNMLVRHSVDLSNIFLYEPGYPGCLSSADMDLWTSDANSMFGRVFDYFSQGDLESAVEALIDGSGNKKGYFMSQPEKVKMQQIEKSKTLAYQLGQQEQPNITVDTLSKINRRLTISYGTNTRCMFRLVSSAAGTVAKGANLTVVEGEGHMLPIENPKKFSFLIKDYLQS